MRALSVSVVAAMLISVLAPGAVVADSSISLSYGANHLSKVDWAPVEQQDEYGVVLETRPQSWAAALVAGYHVSSAEITLTEMGVSGTFTGDTTTLTLGVRGFVVDSVVRIYLEGGIALITNEVGLSIPTFGLASGDSGTGSGYWLGAGLDIKIGENLSLGVALRETRADVFVGGYKGAGGGQHTAVSSTFRF